MNCLLDSGAVIALAISNDDHAPRARAFYLTPGLRLFTTSVIVGEAYTYIRRRRGFEAAISAVRTLRPSGVVTIAPVGAHEDNAIWRTLEDFAGVPLSYADASLVALGRARRIAQVFSFDEDFRLAGLRLVPE